MTVSDSERRFVARLLNWYDAHGRHDLPWRASDSSAFEVLAAELMLQQTSVEQVKTVYPKFVERYRTPDAVANSTDLAGKIEPLGLAKRVEYFKRVSKRLIREHDGRVPKSRSELMELHGVGEYTACSVLAHVHGQNTPAVDTNVARILSRVFGLGTADAPSNRRNWEVAERLSPPGRSSDFTHALIDFGAGVCTAANPDCGRCPVGDICEYGKGGQSSE